jgi:hypothetical protein
MVWAALYIPAAAGAEIQTIKVSNAREFLEAIGSNRVIQMAPGVYNLTPYEGRISNATGEIIFENLENEDPPKVSEGVTWEWGELVLSGINNLTIHGPEGDKAGIVIENESAFVMRFEDCGDILIRGISAGHLVEGYCMGGVFCFKDSSGITITDTDMYGCGTEGLTLENVDHMKVVNSQIYECTFYIMTVTGGRNISFENCVFRDNREYTLVNVSETVNMSFTDCKFTGNRSEQSRHDGRMFSVTGTTISVTNCAFSGNKTDEPTQNNSNVSFANCSFN